MLGMHGTVYSNYAINDADLLLALGVRFDDRVTQGQRIRQARQIVHIDIDPSELNKNKAAHVPLHGDVKSASSTDQDARRAGESRFAGGCRYGDWMRQIEEWREAEPLRYADRDDAILPQYAIDRLYTFSRAQST